MESSNSTVQAYLSGIRIVHLAILTGIVLFAGILYYLARTGDDSKYLDAGVFQTLGASIGLFTIAGAYFLFRFRLGKINDQISLIEKLAQYRTAHILKLALLEGGAIFNLVLFYLGGDILLLAFAGLAALVIALNYPGVYRISNDLKLSDEDIRKLNTPEFTQ